MAQSTVSIGIVAPATPIEPETAGCVTALAAELFGKAVELVFHPQCFSRHGHFAGHDAERADAFVELANDPALSAIWVARGGYGSGRIAEDVLARLGTAASAKTFMGYSDAGMLLGGLYARGIGRPVHGPMPNDIRREGGKTAVARALNWLVKGDATALEPHIGKDAHPAVAFNITILSSLLGTPLQPDLSGHVLMLEEVSEYHYRIDRALFHITSNPGIRKVAGIRLGRCSDIPENDVPFGMEAEEIAQYWCAHAGIAYLGQADIGHDAANRVVPFGSPSSQRRPGSLPR